MKAPIVYGASRASIPERSKMWKDLRAAGANIISSWIDESGEGETGDFVELWARIEAEIRKCDRLVLYVEDGDMPLKGALVEVGMAIGLGKPVLVVNKDIKLNERDFRPLGSWLKHPLVSFCSDIHEAVGLNKDLMNRIERAESIALDLELLDDFCVGDVVEKEDRTKDYQPFKYDEFKARRIKLIESALSAAQKELIEKIIKSCRHCNGTGSRAWTDTSSFESTVKDCDECQHIRKLID